MSLQPIDPYDDPRVTHEFAVLNDRKYHYVHGMPKQQPPRATVLCCHGFPDLWYSWRHIIPGLLEMGLRVIVPDLIGFGQTDAPVIKPGEPYTPYGLKASADDMAELLRQLNIPKVILLGHDWGAAVVHRIYLHHPEMISRIASVCVPYWAPTRSYVPIEEVVKKVPSLTYQIAFADPQTELEMRGKDEISRFLRALHRGLEDVKSTGSFQVPSDLMKHIGDQPRGKLMTEKDLEYYVEQFSRNGMHGPLNWYKTRYTNYMDEKDLKKETVDVPFLFVGATHDVTPPSMAELQAKYIPNSTSRVIKSSHWVPEEKPEELLGILREWMEAVCFGSQLKL